jgi:hypothetical protein
MKIKYLLLILVFTGCEKFFFEDDPQNNAVNNFELFWSDFDNYYSQFIIRNINWDTIYNEFRPKISEYSTDEQLFTVLSDIVTSINDMHVNLFTPLGNASWQKPYPDNYPSSKLIANNLNINLTFPNSALGYGKFRNHEIGYIKISTFITQGNVSNRTDSRFFKIDNILNQFKELDGIIVDVRMNNGGNSSNAELIASRFADKKRLYTRHRYKNGQGDNDFSEWKEWYIEPDGEFQYTRPVVVLTSRATSSSAEDFVMAMQVFPHITIVGDTTGGGTGSPIRRELPNGWNYRLSTSYAITNDNLIVDGNGIPPDVTILTSITDSINGIDRICEKGIEIIEQKQ